MYSSITSYLKFQIIEVADEKAPDSLSEAELVQAKGREGERILAIDGKLWSSEELAAELDWLGPYGTSHVVFLIGGSHGLSDEVILLVLTEQIYRAVKINRGEPYHK